MLGPFCTSDDQNQRVFRRKGHQMRCRQPLEFAMESTAGLRVHRKDVQAFGNIQPIKIVHVHLLTEAFQSVLFRRADGFWMPVSGTVEVGESFTKSAIREVEEETGLDLQEDQILATNHCFTGISPKGRFLKGQTFYAALPDFFDPSDFKFNGELTQYEILSPRSAMAALHAFGMQEARQGLASVLAMEIERDG